jgi:formate dehydrogenase major subunit
MAGNPIGGITSSRCTNEEAYLVQKLIRAGFGNNNVDTCARVCHSPTGYGLNQAFGTSAGTQNFDSVEHRMSSSSSAPIRPTVTRCSVRA